MKKTLVLHAQDGWYLKSKGATKVVLRSYDAEGMHEKKLDLAGYDAWRQGPVLEYELSRVQALLPVGFGQLTKIDKDDVAQWQKVLDYLNTSWPTPVPASFETETGDEKPKRIIPVIRLRRLYRFLRALPASEIPALLAHHFSEKPELLLGLVREGRTDIEKYAADPAEGFHPERKKDKLWWPHCLDKSAPFAKWLTAKLGEKGVDHEFNVIGAPELNFHALDYQVNPLRTPKAIYEDGVSGRRSGQGGIDLLLYRGEGIPVIGEIKAATDVDLFTALVQALVYAVELSSNAQRTRLARACSANGHPPLKANCGLDIFLIYEEASNGRDLLKTFAWRVVQSILKDHECSTIVSRIAFVSCSQKEGEPVFTHAPLLEHA